MQRRKKYCHPSVGKYEPVEKSQAAKKYSRFYGAARAETKIVRENFEQCVRDQSYTDHYWRHNRRDERGQDSSFRFNFIGRYHKATI